jgi:hypothetical protein
MLICHASKNALEIQLEVGLKAGNAARESVIELAMSLKRHAYAYIDEGAAKDQNSVLHSSVDVPALVIDAEDIGRQIQAAHASNPFTLLSENMDFTTQTRRVYRCDNHRGRDGFNHFYPIRGAEVWNCDMAEFEKLQALRRLQRDAQNGTESVKFTNWRAFQRNDEEWKTLRKKLVAVSGDTTVLAELEQLCWAVNKKKADPFASSGNFGLPVSFAITSFDDDSPLGTPSRSRSSSDASGSRRRSNSESSGSSSESEDSGRGFF